MSNVQDNQKLWQFPCDFAFKAMALAKEGVENEVVTVIQQFVPGDYSPKLRPSKNGKYVSITINFTATSRQQLDAIYVAVNQLDSVKVCL